MNNLFEVLNIKDEKYDLNLINNNYLMSSKTEKERIAWHILRDEFYFELYKETKDIKTLIESGYWDNNENIDFYSNEKYFNLNFLTTPVNKLNVNNLKEKNIVLLSTGGFYPLHDGHIDMMNLAKERLLNKGYNVIGGYISPSHDNYVLSKENMNINCLERIHQNIEKTKDIDWLMIDPWESIYLKNKVNFTDVIIRLENYLKKHISKNIEVYYVFGSDNIGFVDCFKSKGNCICVNRLIGNNDFNVFKEKYKNYKNILFIENNLNTFYFCSSDLRRKENIVNNTFKNNLFFIRNDELLSLENYVKNSKLNLELKQKKFTEELIEEFLKNNLDVKIDTIKNQINKIELILSDKKTISLDSFYKGTYNLEVSRLFNLSDFQYKPISLTNRIGSISILEQIKNIKTGDYILVDDDSISGNTLKYIKTYLDKDINILEDFLILKQYYNNIFDTIDVRDFIFGSINGGLTVCLPNNSKVRVPYILPYVSPFTRASILKENELNFSKKIIDMNIEFFSETDLKIKDSDIGFKLFLNYIGFNDEDFMLDVCIWMKNLF